jgi:hypothetical protein
VVLSDCTREAIALELEVSTRTVQELIRIASTYIDLFNEYTDDNYRLNGLPIDSKQQVEVLRQIRQVRQKYRHVKDKSFIKKEYQKINQRVKEEQNGNQESNS